MTVQQCRLPLSFLPRPQWFSCVLRSLLPDSQRTVLIYFLLRNKTQTPTPSSGWVPLVFDSLTAVSTDDQRFQKMAENQLRQLYVTLLFTPVRWIVWNCVSFSTWQSSESVWTLWEMSYSLLYNQGRWRAAITSLLIGTRTRSLPEGFLWFTRGWNCPLGSCYSDWMLFNKEDCIWTRNREVKLGRLCQIWVLVLQLLYFKKGMFQAFIEKMEL